MRNIDREIILLRRSWRRVKRRSKLLLRKKQKNRFLGRKTKLTRLQFNKDRNAYWVVLEPIFNFNLAPENVVEKILELERMLHRGKGVYVDMNKVTEIDYASLACLLAVIYKFSAHDLYFNGSFPDNADAKKFVKESGFIPALFLPLNQSVYWIDANNQFVTASDFEEFEELVDDRIIPDVSKAIWGTVKRVPGLRKVLQELIYNTAVHASEYAGDKRWWLSINYDRKEKKVSFTFLDYGIGILSSLAGKKDDTGLAFQAIATKIGINNKDKIMMEILEKGGLTATREGKHGTGIHGIKLAEDRKLISSLYLASNNVVANTSKREYKKINSDFPGTLFHWEIEYSTVNFE